MGTVLTFNDFFFSSTEVLAVAGEIEYPYIAIAKLRSYTTVQIAAKTTETIELVAILSPARLSTLESLATNRSRSPFLTGTKNWGDFRIESIRREERADGLIRAAIKFGQTTLVATTGDFTPLPLSIGTFGIVDFLRPELLDPLEESLEYPSTRLARFQSFPKIQDAGDGLIELSLDLAFDSLYNVSPITRLDTFRALGDTYSFYTLDIQGKDYGDFVLKRIAWNIVRFGSTASLDAIAVKLDLLESPTFFPPKKPQIFGFSVNGVEKVATLATNVTSLTYQDPIDGGTSLLEVEFDSEATGLPVEGDIIRVIFGYEQDSASNRLNTGNHRCDRPHRRYSPDTVAIGSQSYDYTLALNTKAGVTYTATPLSSIVSSIAGLFGLALNGTISTIFAGTAQNTTSSVSVTGSSYFDLLQQLASDYGYAFALKYNTLYFRGYDALNTQGQTFGLTPSDCISAEFTTKIKGTYRTALFPYKTGSASLVDTNIANNDELDFRPSPYYQDLSAATRRSQGELFKHNRQKHEGTLVIEGKYNAIAGINILLVSFRESADNGTFQVDQATHRIDANSGWTTELKIRKVF